MNQSESDYKNSLEGMFRFMGFEAERHEDQHRNFIPDMSFAGNRTDGWMEVKWCDVDPPSLGALAHWTRGQEQWLHDRGRKGSGHCYLLVGTPRRHILWRYDSLAAVRGQRFEAAMLYAICVASDLEDLSAFLAKWIRPPGRVPA